MPGDEGPEERPESSGLGRLPRTVSAFETDQPPAAMASELVFGGGGHGRCWLSGR